MAVLSFPYKLFRKRVKIHHFESYAKMKYASLVANLRFLILSLVANVGKNTVQLVANCVMQIDAQLIILTLQWVNFFVLNGFIDNYIIIYNDKSTLI